jgi:hypothetical protein
MGRFPVIPAKAGTQEPKSWRKGPCAWAPAFAGVTSL